MILQSIDSVENMEYKEYLGNIPEVLWKLKADGYTIKVSAERFD